MLVIKKSETVCGDTDGFAGVTPERITMVDQSPHQLAKAKKKPGLKGVEIQVGDAEKLTFPTNAFDWIRVTTFGDQAVAIAGVVFLLLASFALCS